MLCDAQARHVRNYIDALDQELEKEQKEENRSEEAAAHLSGLPSLGRDRRTCTSAASSAQCWQVEVREAEPEEEAEEGEDVEYRIQPLDYIYSSVKVLVMC